MWIAWSAVKAYDLPHSLELPAKRKRNKRPYQKDQDKILVNQKHQDEICIFFSKSTEISLITIQSTCMLTEVLKHYLIQEKVIGIPGNFQSHEWFQMTSRELSSVV